MTNHHRRSGAACTPGVIVISGNQNILGGWGSSGVGASNVAAVTPLVPIVTQFAPLTPAGISPIGFNFRTAFPRAVAGPNPGLALMNQQIRDLEGVADQAFERHAVNSTQHGRSPAVEDEDALSQLPDEEQDELTPYRKGDGISSMGTVLTLKNDYPNDAQSGFQGKGGFQASEAVGSGSLGSFSYRGKAVVARATKETTGLVETEGTIVAPFASDSVSDGDIVFASESKGFMSSVYGDYEIHAHIPLTLRRNKGANNLKAYATIVKFTDGEPAQVKSLDADFPATFESAGAQPGVLACKASVYINGVMDITPTSVVVLEIRATSEDPDDTVEIEENDKVSINFVCLRTHDVY